VTDGFISSLPPAIRRERTREFWGTCVGLEKTYSWRRTLAAPFSPPPLSFYKEAVWWRRSVAKVVEA
jgi:hypothetical protein